jgi:N utilization substance protein A
VVRYSDDSDSFIKNALTPAKVERIIVQDESSKMVFAVVGMDQLAYAYGKQKKNVILAARLTGWKINIKTEAEIDEEQIESADVKELKNMFIDGTPLDELPGLGEDIIAALQENDVHTVESLVEVDEISGYANLSGLSEDQIKKIKKVLSESVEVEVEGEEGGTDTPNEEDDEGTSLGMLPDFNKKWIEKLKTAGITSIEELVDASQSGRLPGVEGLDAEEVKAIQAVLAENVEVED